MVQKMMIHLSIIDFKKAASSLIDLLNLLQGLVSLIVKKNCLVIQLNFFQVSTWSASATLRSSIGAGPSELRSGSEEINL